ncbi:hypothetical protein PVAP13_9NG403100 [Panicum virgatum]|uniref:Uncharacterized protein n=1 Tax=Panicum virgatum TaxID=38727 RepID=A0A8T0MU06_PANVG|nr:hypothetical protein PVAP13_9NG403100 [Panicum virgatum]
MCSTQTNARVPVPHAPLRSASPTPRNASSPRSCRLPSRLLHPAAPSPPPLAVGTCFCLLPPPATDPRDGLRSRRRSRCGTGRGYARGGRRSCLIRAPLPSPPSSHARLSTASLRLLFAFDTRVSIKACAPRTEAWRSRASVAPLHRHRLLPQDTDPARGSEEGGVLAAVLQDLRLAGCGRKHRATGGRRRLRWSLLQPGAAAALATPPMRGRQAEQRPAVAVARAGRKACCWLWWIWRAWRRWAERWWSAAAAALPVGYATVRSGTVQSQAVGECDVVSVASTYA